MKKKMKPKAGEACCMPATSNCPRRTRRSSIIAEAYVEYPEMVVPKNWSDIIEKPPRKMKSIITKKKMSLAERTRADCGSAPDAAAKAPDDAGCAKPVAEMARPLLPCVGMVMLGESRTERKLRRMERARSATGGDGRGIVRIDGGTWRMARVAPTAGGRRDNKTR